MRRWFELSSFVFVFRIDVVSHSDEFLVSIGSSQDEDGDTEDVFGSGGGEEFGLRGGGGEVEARDAYRDGTDC